MAKSQRFAALGVSTLLSSPFKIVPRPIISPQPKRAVVRPPAVGTERWRLVDRECRRLCDFGPRNPCLLCHGRQWHSGHSANGRCDQRWLQLLCGHRLAVINN